MIISLGREQFIKIENYKENLKINIFDIIEKKKEIIIKDFINQFYKICYDHKIKKKSLIQNYIEKSGINLLVISDFYEKNIWKNKEIKEIFILLALKRFILLDKSLTISGKIQLSPTFFYLKSLNKIKLTNLVIIKKNNKNLNSAIWILLKFLKQAVFNVPFLILCSKKNFKVNDVVFSYSTFIDGKKNKDFYWKNIEKINISPDYYKLIINIPSHISNINKISFANSSERIIFLESYQNLATLSKSIYLWLKLRFYLKNKNFFLDKENQMFYTYFKNSLFSFSSLKNIHYYFMIKNFLKNKKIKNIHYLFENISWEKSLNFLAKNIICKAYHHTFLIDWDMRYEIHEKEKKEIKKYLPKIIYSSSQLIIKNLKKKMKIKKEITFKKISSLRYSDNCISNQTKTKKINKILVVGDVDEEVTWKMVNLVNKSKLSFDLKVHPASNYKVFKKSNVKTVDGDLNFLIRKYKFILCGNSSSSVYNCKLNNVNFFVYKDFYDLNINPFKNTNLKYITNMKDFDKLR